MRYEKQLLTDYKLTRETFNDIVSIGRRAAGLAYDRWAGEYCATTLAEAIIDELRQRGWPDEETRSTWSIAADLCDELESRGKR